jgi:hypothetical protein
MHTHTHRATTGTTNVFRPVQRVDSITSLPDDEPPFSPLDSKHRRIEEVEDEEDYQEDLLSIDGIFSSDSDSDDRKRPNGKPAKPHRHGVADDAALRLVKEAKKAYDESEADKNGELDRLKQASLAFRRKMEQEGLDADDMRKWKETEDRVTKMLEDKAGAKDIQRILRGIGDCVVGFPFYRHGDVWICSAGVCKVQHDELKSRLP